jgi:hypothetical protein
MPSDAEESRNLCDQLLHALAPRPSDNLPDYLEPGWDGEPDISQEYLDEYDSTVQDPTNDALYSGTAGRSELDGVYPVYGNDKPDTSGRGW